MRPITTALERIALCKRMHRSLVRFSEPASYVRSLSWVDFIINTFGFSFRYTQTSAFWGVVTLLMIGVAIATHDRTEKAQNETAAAVRSGTPDKLACLDHSKRDTRLV